MSVATWRALALVFALGLVLLGAGAEKIRADHFLHADHFATKERGFGGCDAAWKACRLALDPSKPATEEEDATDDPGPCGLGWDACYQAIAEP